jgi:lysophospholipase L1-like esterase
MRARSRLIPLLVGLVVAILLAEAAVRVLGLVEYPPRLHQPDSTNVYTMRPGFRGKTSHGVPIRVNALGARGPEVSATKRPGTFRILLLGDSMTFGSGIREETSFAALLERALDARGDGRDYEILNFGTSGYNTVQERNLLRMKGPSLEPDLVLVGFFSNDIDPFRFAGQIDPRHRLLVKIKEAVRENFRLYPFLHGRLQRLRQRFAPSNADAQTLSGESPGFDEAIAALADIRDLAAGYGARVLVVLIPKLKGLDGDYPLARFDADFLAACAARGIPAANLLPHFRGEDASKLWLRPDDGHPNERGHEILATGIYREMEKAGALAGDSPAAGEQTRSGGDAE